MQFRVRAPFPLPEVASGGPIELMVSPDARRALVSWREGDAVIYRSIDHDRGDEWSEPIALRIDESLSLQAALDSLRHSIEH